MPKHKTRKAKTPRKAKHRLKLRRRIRLSWRRYKAKLARRYNQAMGPKVIAQAKRDFVDGENLRPVIQPPVYRHYVAPEDVEEYLAVVGNQEVEFHLLPEDPRTLEQSAMDAACEMYGMYMQYQPLQEIRPLNAAARIVCAALPTRGVIHV